MLEKYIFIFREWENMGNNVRLTSKYITLTVIMLSFFSVSLPLNTNTASASTLKDKEIAKLYSLPTRAKVSKTDYARANFGATWFDVDHNGCDTRNDILKRDLTFKLFSTKCIVTAGILKDVYSGKTIVFKRGTTTSSKVQIDHIVPLANAWQTGAKQLSQGQRTAFANDPLNLQAVDGVLNQQKSDKDASQW